MRALTLLMVFASVSRRRLRRRVTRVARLTVPVLLAATSALAQQPPADAGGLTPLLRAVRVGDVALVRQLLQRGTDVSQPSPFGVTPLALAVTEGRLPIVEALLAAGADPNTTTGDGETVLMSAASAGYLPVVRALLARKADPDRRDSWLGQTALTRAAGENHGAVVTALLAAGANPNATDDRLEYLGDGAVRAGHAEGSDAEGRHGRAALRRTTGRARRGEGTDSVAGARARTRWTPTA